MLRFSRTEVKAFDALLGKFRIFKINLKRTNILTYFNLPLVTTRQISLSVCPCQTFSYEFDICE
jgi:hypothetical protein